MNKENKPTVDQFIVYTQTDCSFCTKAIELLKLSGAEVESIDIRLIDGALAMMRDNGFKTVPQIYHGTHHIGGYEELVQYMEASTK